MAERKAEPLQNLIASFRSLQLSVVSSLAQKICSVKSKSSSLDARITGDLMLVENSLPRAQIVLSCESKHDKIPLDRG